MTNSSICKVKKCRDNLAVALFEVDYDLAVATLLKSGWKYYEIEEYFLHPGIFA